MSAETDYIEYLEAKMRSLDDRVHELEAVLMLICFNEVNPINKDYMYNHASRQVYKALPFSNETINEYNELLKLGQKINVSQG